MARTAKRFFTNHQPLTLNFKLLTFNFKLLTLNFKLLTFSILPIVLLAIAGCTSLLPTLPRLEQQLDPQPTPTEIVVEAPEPTGEPVTGPPELLDEVDPNPVVTVWVNETSVTHRAVLTQMQTDLIEKEGIYLEFILVDETRLPDLVSTAVLSGTLPDLIIHPVEMTAGWVERGILHPEAGGQLIDQLGSETFVPQALELVTVDGIPSAVPLDAWPQLLLYRKDWYEQLDLDPPDSYAAIAEAGAQIYRSETLSAQTNISSTLISGLVVPTESDLVSTHHTFEQWALANNCRLIDEKGEVTLLHPDCLAALDFYRDVVNFYSPSDVQTDISAINAYLAGRTGMIVTKPKTLVYLAGLEERFSPACPECADNPNYLAENTAIITQVKGEGGADGVAFSHYTYIGITTAANRDLARTVAAYWLGDGYSRWLAIEPENKIPLRLGTPDDPNRFRELWIELPLRGDGPTLSQIYGSETTAQLTDAVADSERWGLLDGQGSLVTQIHEELTIAVVLQEMLSGYFTSSQAVIEGYQRVVDLIPNYAYYIEPTSPEETPDPSEDG